MFFKKKPDINTIVEEIKNDDKAILLDVRSPDEFNEGHIPNSKNIPLPIIRSAEKQIKDKEAPIYCYCYSGSRSLAAVANLKAMGYKNVQNIGGISSYKGELN